MSRIGILLAEGYEDREFTVPYERLYQAGHQLVVLGIQPGSMVHGKRGTSQAEIQAAPEEVQVADFAALVIPGGRAPGRLRLDRGTVEFTRRFYASGKPIAAICHGPQLLVAAGVVKGHTMTSWPALRDELVDAGAHWLDRQVVEDANFITARKPDDLGPFCAALLRRL
jgi:protease I